MSLPSKSFAMVQTGVRELVAMDVDMPDIDDDSALLRLEACGICGSDYEQYEGQLRTPTPVIPGHEPLGVIARIGDRDCVAQPFSAQASVRRTAAVRSMEKTQSAVATETGSLAFLNRSM